MFLINSEEFVSRLSLKKDYTAEELITVPSGMTREKLELMLRVLSAKHPAEIDDIETTEIIDLFELVPDIAPYLGKTSHFDNSGDDFSKKLLSKKTSFSRRVL